MSLNVFYEGLNDFCRKFLVIGSPTQSNDPVQFMRQWEDVAGTLFESFLLFDTVSLKVHGENLPLAMLLSLMGDRAVLDLAESGSLRFVLWTPMVAHITDDIPGIDPLTYGNLSSAAHSDPEESLALGLSRYTKKLDRSNRRALIRKLRDTYTIPDMQLAAEVVEISKSAYESGRLKGYGLDPSEIAYRDIPLKKRETLSKCAGSLLEYKFAMSNNMTSYSNRDFYEFLSQSCGRLSSVETRLSGFTTLARLENIPDLKQLYAQIEVPFSKMIALRKKRASRNFREWLSLAPCDVAAPEGLSKYYLDALMQPVGLFQSTGGKLAKSIAMTAIGAGIGMATESPYAGALLGGLAGIASVGAGFGLDLVDQFLLEGITKGWTPRVFFDGVRTLE
ncbi:hypothetical protein ACPUER_01955 [Burkholderia sp. DN3021]|uniref:hypothetical protein n=1 Tax=Burkholderia sp. DN3021 TaxID=3410137 RepID=UPI003C7D44BB